MSIESSLPPSKNYPQFGDPWCISMRIEVDTDHVSVLGHGCYLLVLILWCFYRDAFYAPIICYGHPRPLLFIIYRNLFLFIDSKSFTGSQNLRVFTNWILYAARTKTSKASCGVCCVMFWRKFCWPLLKASSLHTLMYIYLFFCSLERHKTKTRLVTCLGKINYSFVSRKSKNDRACHFIDLTLTRWIRFSKV